MAQGMIFDIKRFALHDGPGIRTTVFLKGCPLSCIWCHNPESISPHIQLMFNAEKCLGCGGCEKSCGKAALRFADGRPAADIALCDGCGACAENCPSGALEVSGVSTDTAAVMDTVARDKIFYSTSGGGMTISGGEPLFQPEFTLSLLRSAAADHISTALDTSGYAPEHIIKSTVPYTDIYLYDIKTPSKETHRRYTGVDNDIILSNLKYLAKTGKEIIIRFPLIRGVNDDEHSLTALKNIMDGNGLTKINVLPFHRLGYNKYIKLGMKTEMPREQAFSETELSETCSVFSDGGIECSIGG